MKISTNKALKRQEVSAGTLGETAKAVRQFFDTVLRQIDKFIVSKGLKETGKEEEIEGHFSGKVWKGYRKFYESASGNLVAVTVYTDPDDDQMCNMQIEVKGAPKLTLQKKGVAKSKLAQIVEDWFQANFDDVGSNEGEVESAKRIQVTLKRVSAGTEDNIQLVAINANCHIVHAMDIVGSVLDDDEFASTIGEDPVSFEIVDEEGAESYDVEELPDNDIDTDGAYEAMFAAAVRCYHNIQAIHWGAKGERMWELHNAMDSFIWSFKSRIDTLAELVVEKTKKVPHIGMICCNSDTCESDILEKLETGFTKDEGLQFARAELVEFISVMEGYYVNLDHDIQSMLDNWIRDDKRNADYFLDRQLDPAANVVTPL